MIKNEIIIFKDNDLELEVNVSPKEETVWLTQRQMADLFVVSYNNINLHIINILKTGELEEISVSKESLITAKDGKKYKTKLFNLDMIIAVGYRVNSKRGTTFRRWANSVLKEYVIKGYAVDTKRVSEYKEHYLSFTKTVEMISSLVDRKELTIDESKSLLNIINKYSYALGTLDKYDHKELTISNITKDERNVKLDYEKAIKEIKSLDDYQKNDLFGREKDNSFQGALNAIYQTAFGEDVYPSVEEKAANLLYFLIKDHPFLDGNKRIAASMFVWFLDMNNILYKSCGSKIIEDNALVSFVLMIALSNSVERDIITKLIINLINKTISMITN